VESHGAPALQTVTDRTGTASPAEPDSADRHEPTAYRPALFPVSVKAVVVRDGRVLLLRNERGEWEAATRPRHAQLPIGE